MATKKKNGSSNLGWIIFPLLCINIYAYWQLTKVAEHWGIKLFGSIADSLTQLAIILLVNTVVIIILSITKL